MKYLKAATAAAERMKLFGKPDSAALGSPKILVATSQTAWGLFNFLVYENDRTLLPDSDVDFCVQTNESVPGGHAT